MNIFTFLSDYNKCVINLDTAAWNIGREWCYATNPDCRDCPISNWCLKKKRKNKDQRG